MPSLKNIIDGHNKNILVNSETANSDKQDRKCNCRNKESCPLEGKCLSKNVVYQAKVTSNNQTETYVGLTESEFKTWYNNHKSTFNNSNRKNSTELSKHIWQLKENNSKFTIEWSILSHASPYSNNSKRCNLCICEKFYIICKPGIATLNKRQELVNTCRHSSKFLLKNAWPWPPCLVSPGWTAIRVVLNHLHKYPI